MRGFGIYFRLWGSMSYNLYAVLMICILAIYLATILHRVRKEPLLYPFAYTFGFSSFWLSCSCLYIESGIFISEQGYYGHFNFSTLYYVAAGTLAWVVIELSFGTLFIRRVRRVGEWLPLHKLEPGQRAEWYNLVLTVVVVSLGALYTNLALSPVPLLDPGLDRFDYWTASRFPTIGYVIGSTSQFLGFALSMLIVCDNRSSKRRQQVLFIIFISYCGYLIMLGDKFSSLAKVLFLFSVPFVVTGRIKLVLNAKSFLTLVSLAGMFGGLIFYHYSGQHHYAGVSQGVTGAIVYRALALQGHLWWGMIDQVVAGHINPTNSPADLIHGMHNLMYLFGGWHSPLVTATIERGVSMTNAYPAILIYVFPLWLAIPIHAIFVLGTAKLVKNTVRLMRQYRIVDSIISMQVVQWVMYSMVMGQFSQVLSLKVGVCIVFLSVLEMRYRFKRNRGHRGTRGPYQSDPSQHLQHDDGAVTA